MATLMTAAVSRDGWLKKAASPVILFYALPWLIVILCAGTYAQKDIGLFEAQRLYFSSWFLWLGPLPLPGAYPTLTAITASLLAKFLLYSPWRAHQAGIIVTHLGVIVLMGGGLLTAFGQEEGYISFKPGDGVAAARDYRDRVFTVTKDGETIQAIDFRDLENGMSLSGLPFKVRIDDMCENCSPVRSPEDDARRGFAAQAALVPAPPEKEQEANLSGVTFSVEGAGEDQDGIYAVMEEIPHRPAVAVAHAEYGFSIGRRQTGLPFTIELVKFERAYHPGTDTPSGFESHVLVHDAGVDWPYIIRMNEPLRYKGYTFYQSSFSVRPDGEYSVLSVVTNPGRIFPYLASALIFAGLLLHLVIRIVRRMDA